MTMFYPVNRLARNFWTNSSGGHGFGYGGYGFGYENNEDYHECDYHLSGSGHGHAAPDSGHRRRH